MDDEMDEAAMASMMGFSSFGDQDRPNKKRRFNPGADAAVDSSVTQAATGSNSAPLGVRSHIEGTNPHEVHLEEDLQNIQDQPTADSPTISAHPSSLPQRPAAAILGMPLGSQVPREAAKADTWYQDYYDSLSNSNPWEKLEQNLGLQPRGIWPSQAEKSKTEANRA